MCSATSADNRKQYKRTTPTAPNSVLYLINSSMTRRCPPNRRSTLAIGSILEYSWLCIKIWGLSWTLDWIVGNLGDCPPRIAHRYPRSAFSPIASEVVRTWKRSAMVRTSPCPLRIGAVVSRTWWSTSFYLRLVRDPRRCPRARGVIRRLWCPLTSTFPLCSWRLSIRYRNGLSHPVAFFIRLAWSLDLLAITVAI